MRKKEDLNKDIEGGEIRKAIRSPRDHKPSEDDRIPSGASKEKRGDNRGHNGWDEQWAG